MKVKYYPCKSDYWRSIDLIPSLRLTYDKYTNTERELYFSFHFLIYQLDIEIRF